MTILLVISLVLAPGWRAGHAAGRPGESCCTIVQHVDPAATMPERHQVSDSDDLSCCAKDTAAATKAPDCGDSDRGCPSGQGGDCPCECCKVAPSLPLLVHQASRAVGEPADIPGLIPGQDGADSRDLRPPSPPPKFS